MISQYVIKLHSQCNLSCNHCYVYEHADQSWRNKPRVLTAATADAAAARIAEHARGHRLSSVRIVLHGGEPLLVGIAAMSEILDVLNTRIAPVARVDVRVHTNGLLLDKRWCELFGRHGVRVGVSLDGDRLANDRHRRFADGRSSHDQVLRALALLREPEHRDLYAGILCTIDIANDPVAVYQGLIAEAPPRLDLLLPHATWENPPHRPDGQDSPYAAWLIAFHQRWVRDGRPVPIRLFDSIASTAAGGPSWTAAVGLDPVDLVIIETDGSFEEPDSLKVAYDGAPSTNLDVFRHTVDQVAARPHFAARMRGLAALSAPCRACTVVRICGGGLYAHRYRADSDFDNPSVYCADLKAFIDYLTPRVSTPAAGARSRTSHGLPAGTFLAFAAGPGDSAGMDALTEAHLSVTRALLATVASAGGDWRDQHLRQAAAEGWALLCAVDAEHPAAARDVLMNPHVRAWAARCLSPPSGVDTERDRAHMAGIAAAAAIRAGITATLPAPVREGSLYLPGVGALTVDANPASTAVISVSPRQISVAAGGGAWRTARWFNAGSACLTVEDLDPFRDCFDWPAAGGLSWQAWRTWRAVLATAAERLRASLPGYARALDAGLRCVVPLKPDVARERSATARQAFGCVAIALPRDAARMDALLLHEFQHVKLHALIDMYDLFDPSDVRRMRVPWRPDPRPVEGVLHGAYAHLALAHLWRSRGESGRIEYLRFRDWVSEAAEALAKAGSLTPDGERFVAVMFDAARDEPDPSR